MAETRTPFQQAYDGLMLIALNPSETKARRRRASRALAEAGRGSPQPCSHTIEPSGFVLGGAHGGGHAMATFLEYEGGGRP